MDTTDGSKIAPVPFFLAILLAIAAGGRAQDQQQLPITGDAGAGLEHFDALIQQLMDRRGVPGAALAIVKDGKLVLARGYGFADVEAQEPVQPDSLFPLASVSKSITAVTILKLVEQQRLGLDDKVLNIISDIQPLPGAQMDPRWNQITVRMLLNHSGGWDRKTSGDPSGWTMRIARAEHVRPPIHARQMIRYMLGVPLDFDPGTQEVYSNFGFVLLGQIIEEVTERPYAEYVKRHTLEPMGIPDMRVDGLPGHYERDEVKRYPLGGYEPLRGGAPPMNHAAGGWIASCVDMARFLSAVDGSRQQQFLSDAMMQQMLAQPPPPLQIRENGSWFGLGWDVVEKTDRGMFYCKDGGLPGVSTWIGHFPIGVDVVVLFNAHPHGHEQGPELVAEARRELTRALREVQEWPDVDFFEKYP